MKNLNQDRNPKQRHYECMQNALQQEMSGCPLKTNAEQQQFVKQTIKLCLSTPRCGIAPLILNCCIKWGLVVSFKPRSSYRLDKTFQYQLNRRLVGHHNRSERFGVKTNVLPFQEFKTQPLDWPARRPGTTATEPFQEWAHFNSTYMIKIVPINASLTTEQRSGRQQLGRHHCCCPELHCTKMTVVGPALPTGKIISKLQITNTPMIQLH
jgi:hypothetical protein